MLLRGVWTPKFDYKVARAVSCPEPFCRSNVGWVCTTKTGKDSSTVHAARYKKYWRLMNAQQEQANS